MESDWFEDAPDAMSTINITPLVDVALVLLIIFMITAPMMVQGADVRLPRTAPLDRLPPDANTVVVTATGEILLNGVAVPLEELEQRLGIVGAPGDTVYFRGDRELLYGFVLEEIVEQIKAAGMNLALITETEVERLP